MKYVLLGIVFLVFVFLPSGLSAQEMHEGRTVYIPLVSSRVNSPREILITLVDQTPEKALPIKWFVSTIADGVIETGDRKYDTRNIFMWSMKLEVGKEYYIEWYGRNGWNCTKYKVVLTEKHDGGYAKGWCD